MVLLWKGCRFLVMIQPAYVKGCEWLCCHVNCHCRMPQFQILLINTHVPRSTKQLVEDVRQKHSKAWDAVFLIMLLLLHYIHFNGLFSRKTWVSRHQKGKPFWILLEQEMMGWQWHQLDHMQINCALLQTIMPVPHHSVFTGRMPFLPPNQQHQSTEVWRQVLYDVVSVHSVLSSSVRHCHYYQSV